VLAATAENKEDFNIHLRCFFTLPTDFLPTNVRTKALAENLKLQQTRSDQPKKKSDLTENERIAARISKLASEGHIAKAVRSIVPSPLADVTNPEVLNNLKSKHPQRAMDIPEKETVHKTKPFSGDAVISTITSLSNGVGSAFSQWTKELLKAATMVDPSIADDIGMIAAKLLDGWADPLTHKILTTSRLIALDKQSKTNKVDTRPICVGELLMKVIGSLCFKSTPLDVHKWQKGINTRYGTIIVHRQVQKWVEEGRAILTIDCKNAFNAVSRASVYHELVKRKDTHELLVKHFDLAYRSPSDLIVLQGEDWFSITSDEGTRQGDLPAGYYFSLPFGSIIDAIETTCDKEAYADDLTISHTNPMETLICAEKISSDLQHVHLSINLSKCELVCHNPSQEVVAKAKILGIPIIDPSTTAIRAVTMR
jgi:hypothetical protein